MTDPKRWREEDAPAVVAFVETLRTAEPSAEMREAIWTKIAAGLPPPGGTTPGSTGGSSASGSSGGGLALGGKAIAGAVAALGAAAFVGWLALRAPKAPDTAHRAEPIASAAQVAPSSSPSIDPPLAASTSAVHDIATSATSATVGPPSPRVASTPPPHASHPPAIIASVSATPSSSTAADRLREEAEGVRRVRQLLRDKNAAGALAELDRLARLVPNGPLAEEREVLAIEAVAASGDQDGARRRAERFLFERPTSVHAPRVRAYTGR